METKVIGTKNTITLPRIAVGMMRIADMDEATLTSHIDASLQEGLNFFDHADIYGGGMCETKFGQAVSQMNLNREDYYIQSKCAIVPGKMYDFSYEHIMKSVDQSLKRLQTEYLDILLLHRPDALCEPEEVAKAFDDLEKSGKVRHFGVSNHSPMQMELLKKYVRQELIINQLQMSIPFSNMVAEGLEVNMLTDGGLNRDGYVLDYCRLHDITIQAWSPFQFGFFEGNFIGHEKYEKLNKTMQEIAEKYSITPTGVATAWLLRHPAKLQMIAGSTRVSRLKEMIAGSEIILSREEWYRLYLDAGHILP